ncbi:MAG: hypothetical protein A2Y24_06845 [Clostridiales bacterium GWE2_32_10]|nr:MAG: hypothetical protein A2Y24_06845 [Clostridiales bacterium GWE2_32_10]
MKDIMELKRQVQAKIKEARELIEKVEVEKRAMSDDENKNYDEMMTEIENRKKEISREERLQQLEMEKVTKTQELADGIEQEFRSFGEFVQTLRFNDQDERLKELRDMSANIGEKGGILIPTIYREQILNLTPTDAVAKPRATVIPADSIYPDAEITMPALDQSGAKGVYSGVTVRWTGAGEEVAQSDDPTFRDITLKPEEVSAYVVVSNKLLRNVSAINAIVQGLLRKAILSAEDHAFLTGDGVKKPKGILNSKCALKINRNTANTIKYADIVNMYAQFKGTSPIWVTTPTALPQLMQMVDTANNLIWQPNARDGVLNTLIGVPVMITDRVSTLGSYGDLALIDFSAYMIKDGSGIFLSASEHPKFTQNKTIIKAVWNVDGDTWLNSPLTLEDKTTKLSPVVVLDVPTIG